MHSIEQLQAISCFSGLEICHLQKLAPNLVAQTFERGETIFHQGSLGSVMYGIVSGQVRIFTVSEAGQELSVTILRAGDFFGELALLDGLPRSASAVAMCRTTALLLHRAAFLDAIATHPPIAVSILEAMAARLRQSTNHADMLGTGTATQRITRQLLLLAKRYGRNEGNSIRIDLRLTQDDLASLAGVTRETANRVLASLREQRFITVSRTYVSILDWNALEVRAIG